MLTRREVARRLNRPVDYVSGAIDAQGWPLSRVGNAYVITETQFRRLQHLRRESPRKAAS